MRVESDFDLNNLTPYYTRKWKEAKAEVERLSLMKADDFKSEEVIVGCCPRTLKTHEDALNYWRDEVERFHKALTEPTVSRCKKICDVTVMVRRLKRKITEVEQQLAEVLTQLEKIDPTNQERET